MSKIEIMSDIFKLNLNFINLLSNIDRISLDEDLQCALNIYANKKV